MLSVFIRSGARISETVYGKSMTPDPATDEFRYSLYFDRATMRRAWELAGHPCPVPRRIYEEPK